MLRDVKVKQSMLAYAYKLTSPTPIYLFDVAAQFLGKVT